MESESRGSESSEEKPGNGNGKRQRTSFTPAQIQTLQEEFRRSSNPSPEDMERIADLTGHPRKVVMVIVFSYSFTALFIAVLVILGTSSLAAFSPAILTQAICVLAEFRV